MFSCLSLWTLFNQIKVKINFEYHFHQFFLLALTWCIQALAWVHCFTNDISKQSEVFEHTRSLKIVFRFAKNVQGIIFPRRIRKLSWSWQVIQSIMIVVWFHVSTQLCPALGSVRWSIDLLWEFSLPMIDLIQYVTNHVSLTGIGHHPGEVLDGKEV